MPAPCAYGGVADRAFRRLCVDYGAAYVVSEMVSCKGLCFGDRKSEELLMLDEDEHPAAVQLFGDDPDIMARAAEKAMAAGPEIIDTIWAPAPKIAGNHCGSALMREPELCRRIVAAVAGAVDVPVTVKIRKGYSRQEVNAVEVALACEAGGAAAITVHGRTRDQMYAPPVDWDIIREVKRAVKVPVIGNGDVTDAVSAAALYEHTGCDLVMVGRGALGAPWVFAQIQAYLGSGVRLPRPAGGEAHGGAAPAGTADGRSSRGSALHCGRSASTRRGICAVCGCGRLPRKGGRGGDAGRSCCAVCAGD